MGIRDRWLTRRTTMSSFRTSTSKNTRIHLNRSQHTSHLHRKKFGSDVQAKIGSYGSGRIQRNTALHSQFCNQSLIILKKSYRSLKIITCWMEAIIIFFTCHRWSIWKLVMRRWSSSSTDIWTSTKESSLWIKSGRILFLRNTNNILRITNERR